VFPIAVLAGGLGSRLGALTQDFPKCLIEVKGKPFVHWQISLLKDAGYEDFVFCVSHKADQIVKYLGDGSEFGIRIKYSFDGNSQIGTGGAIHKALSLLGPEFAVVYGDSYLPINYSQVEESFSHRSKAALMTIFQNNGYFDHSNVCLNSDNTVNYNKLEPDARMMHIDYGLSYFKAEAFSGVAPNTFLDLADLLTELSRRGEIMGFEVFNRFYEIGSAKGISDFNSYLDGELL
jgi:NDP-sugar pyrophosphorylase family protein